MTPHYLQINDRVSLHHNIPERQRKVYASCVREVQIVESSLMLHNHHCHQLINVAHQVVPVVGRRRDHGQLEWLPVMTHVQAHSPCVISSLCKYVGPMHEKCIVCTKVGVKWFVSCVRHRGSEEIGNHITVVWVSGGVVDG